MYVNWKSLIGFGIAFWISLSMFNSYFIDPITNAYYPASDDEWLLQISENEIVPQTEIREDNILFPLEDNEKIEFYDVLYWSLVTFTGSLVSCFVMKYVMPWILLLWRIYKRASNVIETQTMDEITQPKRSTSRIPVMVNSKSMGSTQDEEKLLKFKEDLAGSCISLISSNSNVDINIRSSKSEVSSRIDHQMEKQCARLRDEMFTLQSNSLREHAALSRRIEQLLKEKRESTKLLMIAQKESRTAKQQIEELLVERGVLLERLERATKEFKNNMKAKKVALAQLEDAQVTIVDLKHQLDKVIYDKEINEDKIKYLELKPLHEDGINTEIKMGDAFLKENFHAYHKPDFIDTTQSEKEVQLLQKRVLDLEKHADRLWTKKAEKENAATGKDQSSSNATQIIRSKDNIKQDFNSTHEETNFFSKIDNLTDEQRRKILKPLLNFSEDESENNLSIRGPFERFGKSLKSMKNGLPSPRNDIFDVSSFDERDNNDSSTNISDSNDNWGSQNFRFVSNSPEFQKFLREMAFVNRRGTKMSSNNVIF